MFKYSARQLGVVIVSTGLTLTGLTLSCRPVTSTNAVGQGTTVVDPTRYLGTWSLVQVGGENAPGPPLTLTLATSGAQLEATYSDGASDTTETFQLANVDGAVIASVAHEDGSWSIFRVLLLGQSTQLVLEPLDSEVAASGIQSGAVGGRVIPLENDDVLVELTASPQELRVYITGTAGLFVANAFVFQRV
jgi:hypothetical protein